jgi:xanthine dehydrogenase accessory factor
VDARVLLDALAEGLGKHGKAALATVVETKGSVPRHAGAKMVVFPDGSSVGTVGGGAVELRATEEALEAMRSCVPRLLRLRLEDDESVCGGEVTVFVDPVSESPTVVMVGAGHVGRAVAEVATAAGFRAILLDDRKDVVKASVTGLNCAGLVGPIPDMLGAMRLGGSHHVVIATRGHRHDQDALREAVRKKLAYIGMIGSRAKVDHVLRQLEAQGASQELLARVNAPVGLNIGAETPGEIAVAIMAEVIMARRGGTGEPLRGTATKGRSKGAKERGSTKAPS